MPWTPTEFLNRLPSPTWQCRPRVLGLVRDSSKNDVVVDLGAGGRRLAAHVRTVDYCFFEGVDVRGDAQCLPLRDGSVDLLIGTGLLEHVEEAHTVLAEVVRVLKPGGRVHIEVPFLQFQHNDPIDLRRYTQDGLVHALEGEGLRVEESGFHLGPTVTLLWTITWWLTILTEGESRPMRAFSTLVYATSSILAWPFKFLDLLLRGKRSAGRLAFGVYCTAKKP